MGPLALVHRHLYHSSQTPVRSSSSASLRVAACTDLRRRCFARLAQPCKASAASTSYSTSQPAPTANQPDDRVSTSAQASTSSSMGSVEKCCYDWDFGSKISYIKSGTKGPAVLMIHGFGVGAYHYERNIPELSQNHRVWSLELLGQGSSWPQLPLAVGPKLYYSIDTWTQQLRHFIEKHIGEPVYLVGNSLGGYLSVNLAANHPELCKGLVLLNATPFWGFRPPMAQAKGFWEWELLAALDGSVPAPQGLRDVIERYWWDHLRNPATIKSMIQLVYSHKGAADEVLVQRIVDATLHPAALDAFTSIVLSPKSSMDFNQMLDKLQCPVCLTYGREDPWVVPLWGQRLKRHLPDTTYLELSPAGHCPHHEAPTAVNTCIQSWIQAIDAQQEVSLPVGEEWKVTEADGRVVTVSHVSGRPRNVFEHLDFFTWWVSQAFKMKPQPAASS